MPYNTDTFNTYLQENTDRFLDEFGQFIGPDMRLAPVSVAGIGEIARSLDFFMGKNTPERRAFIVENLTTDVV